MKWFKHDTDGHLSEGLRQIKADFGFEGVGRWFTILEIVASKMDETDRCHAEYTVKDWCSFLDCKPNKLRSYLVATENLLKTQVEQNGNKIRISIPNLLKKKDEYSKKSGQTPDKLLTPIKETDTDKEKEKKETQSPKPPSAKKIPETQRLLSVKSLGFTPDPNAKYSENPKQLTDQIVKFLEPFHDNYNRNQVAHNIKLKIQDMGIEYVRMRFIELKEREEDPKSPPIRNRIGYFIGALNGAKL